MGKKSPPAAPEDQPEGIAEWVLTFSDMMSLLLCFFILMFSMSTVDAKKYNAAIKSLKMALEHQTEEELHDLPVVKVTETVEVSDTFAVAMSEMEKISEKMNMFIEDQNIKSQVEVVIDERGLVIKIDSKVMYGLGEAKILPESYKLVSSIAKLLHQNNYKVRVEGHTDNLPISSEQFPSNWELSSGRATSVVRYLIREGIPPERLSAEGFAFYKPITSNATAEGRTLNRRIEIVFKKEDIIEEVLEKKAVEKSEQEALKKEALQEIEKLMQEK